MEYDLKIKFQDLNVRELTNLFRHISLKGFECKGFDLDYIYVKGKLNYIDRFLFGRTFFDNIQLG